MPPPVIAAGSHSRLSVFETCRKRAYLAYVQKIPEPDRGEPPARFNGEWPDERGTRVHKDAEKFVRGEIEELTEELESFRPEFIKARDLYKQKRVICEEMWCFDEDWQVIPWDNDKPNWSQFDEIAFRIKTDNTTLLSDNRVAVIDYKTGKIFGNEVKHAEQLELYGIGAFLKYPDIDEAVCELWYLDHNELREMVVTRKEAFRMLKNWDERNKTLIECGRNEFEPSPSIHNCKYCPYGPKKSGDCEVGVQ